MDIQVQRLAAQIEARLSALRKLVFTESKDRDATAQHYTVQIAQTEVWFYDEHWREVPKSLQEHDTVGTYRKFIENVDLRVAEKVDLSDLPGKADRLRVDMLLRDIESSATHDLEESQDDDFTAAAAELVQGRDIVETMQRFFESSVEELRRELGAFRLDFEKARDEAGARADAHRVRESGLAARAGELASRLDDAVRGLAQLERVIESQMDEIAGLSGAKAALVCIVATQDRLLAGIPAAVEAPPPEVVERVVEVEPPFEYDFRDLPAELARILAELAQGSSRSTSGRVKNMFSVVAKWIENAEERHRTELAGLNDRLEAYVANSHVFRTMTTTIMGSETASGAELSDCVHRIRGDLANAKHERMVQEAEKAQFLASFDCHSYGGIVQQFESAAGQAEVLRGQIDEACLKMKQAGAISSRR